jgi:radical SAM protein with 4Fe4S-binding SPASM domain
MIQLSKKDGLHHDIAGEDLTASSDPRFIEYRRKWEENPKNLDPGNFPIHLDIEVTNVCNLRCRFCATTYIKVKKGFMKWETVKRVLDEAEEYGAYACKFNMRGEPLLHEGLGRFIEYAKKKGIVDVFFNTNGVLLTEEKAKMLIDSGLDRLTISFEGFEKEMYEKNRVGAKFEKVVANVERLRRLRDNLNCTKPKIRVQAVLIPELKDRLDEFIIFWKDRVDQVSYNDMLDNVPKRIKPIKSSWICPFPYQRIMIMWDGTITTCYNDFYGKSAMGNIYSVSIRDCWVSSLENLRKLHIEGCAHEIEACAECPLRMNELKKRGER